MKVNKSLRIAVASVGLFAALIYILHFFGLIYHPYIPAICGGLAVAAYLFGVYAKKQSG
ncbi:hypothetical protein SAMN04488057_12011 [Cyclobacterium lianum]|uniref:Uncharacterized protein n=1 Tax=Cyclobacterium lianum TaxID=388280 RepID=A0A1M7QLL6_9BACT|nr:hypothetical protein [Cyclobacterium lianum]SHN32214.1 hypothetical protein SAMN04488057_12011 [Cyclobacterium lianum]